MSKFDVPLSRRIVVPPEVHGVTGFGSMQLGIVRNASRGRALEAVIYGEAIGPFKTVREAQSAALAFWQEHCSKDSIAKRFTSRSRGGFPVRFAHQTGRMDSASIVASVQYEPGTWASTSFSLGGACQMSDQSDWDLVPLK